MSDLKFIHAADTHLGRQFSGLQRTSPDLANLFRRAGYSSWEKLVRTAVERKVDFVSLAGDVFDGSHTTVKARVAFMDGLQRLHEEGIPVFMALGNHDPLRSFPDSLRSLPGLHIFGPDPETRGLGQVETTQGVIISGASFERSVVTENLARKFSRDKGVDLAIGVLHANVSGYSAHKDYAPCSLDDLRQAGMDIWCLGHVHSARVLWEAPLILYAGTSQGAHAGETGPKGCYLVTVESGGKASEEFLPLAPVRWEKIELDATDAAAPEDLLESVETACAGLVPGPEQIEALVVRINLTGILSRHVAEAIRPDGEIHEMLAERMARLTVPVFPESFCDSTRPEFDPESIIEDEGFLPEFLRLCQTSMEDQTRIGDLVREIRLDLSKRVNRTYIDPDIDPLKLLEGKDALRDLINKAAEEVTSAFFELSAADKG
ncbi:MAG TPA: DNA repair exonuclease [Desulfomonilaceae bacterium]|nr:DNA repair exonuclease [Desulfomonilaceae bacterium]